jgi:hypothetical protein
MWLWLAIGTTAFIGVPLIVGLGIARILGQISLEINGLLEAEEWSPIVRPSVSADAAVRGVVEVRTNLRSGDRRGAAKRQRVQSPEGDHIQRASRVKPRSHSR